MNKYSVITGLEVIPLLSTEISRIVAHYINRKDPVI